MKKRVIVVASIAVILIAVFGAITHSRAKAKTRRADKAGQINGVPGSPNATETIDGSYLPPPPQQFGGTINLSADQSKPYWPPMVVPPKGAPNVLLITDDQGYGVSGTFGGVIPTPALDRVAKMGLR